MSSPPSTSSLKQTVRRSLGIVGLEIYRARGGVYFCRTPHAGRAEQPRSLPQPCRVRLRHATGSAGGFVEMDGAAANEVASFVRLPMLPDAAVDEIETGEVYALLFRHDRRSAIREWRRILRPGGTLMIRGLPDFEAIATAYVNGREGGAFSLEQIFRCTHGDATTALGPEQMCKDVFTRDSLVAELNAAGYEIVSVERTRREPEPAELRLDVVARRRR